VTLPDGQSVKATLAGRDPTTDIAVLKVDGVTLPEAPLGDTNNVKVGHLVLAVGRPDEGGLSASMGAVSAAGGEFRTRQGGVIDRLIRPDLTMYPGFSGGPLVDAQGNIVGITTSHLVRSFNLAIPVSTVNRIVDQLLTKGRIVQGYLGIGFQPVRLPDTTKAALNVQQDTGLIVFTVESGGPAAQSGAQIGDILLALDDTAVTDIHEIQGLLGPDRVGKPIQAHIIRGGSRTTLTITVGERPQRER
jgi:S1-C subfamily serine protease